MRLPLAPEKPVRKILFFDTETSGKVNFKCPYTHPKQPHLVQLAAVVIDSNFREHGNLCALVKPEGYEIPKEATAIHGIHTEDAIARGWGLATVLERLNSMASDCDLIVAHNIAFDALVLETAYYRARVECLMRSKPAFCTLKASTPLCKLHPMTRGEYKWPKLVEALQILCGEELINAHDALADTRACASVFFKIVEMQES